MSFFDMIANHPAQPLVLDAIFVVIGIIIVMSILDDLIPFAFDVYEYVIEPRLRLMWNNNNNNNSNSNSRGNRNSSRNSNSIIIRNNNSRRRASEEEPLSIQASTGRVVSNNNVEEDTSYYYLPPQLLLQTINSGVDNMPAQSEGVVARDQGRPPVYPRRRRRRRRRTSNRTTTIIITTTTNNDNNTNEDRIVEEEDASTPTLPVLSDQGLAPPVDTSTVASLFSDFASHGGEDEGDENSNNTNTGAEEEVGDVNNTTASFSFTLPSDFGTSVSNSGDSGVGNEDAASLTYSESNGDGELDFDLDTLDDNTNLSSTQQPEEPTDIDILANEDSDEVDMMDWEPIPEESNELFGVPLAPAQEEEEIVVVEDLPQELLSEVEAVDDRTAEMDQFSAAGACTHVETVAEEEEEVLEEEAQVDEGGEVEATATIWLGSVWVKHPKYACMVRRSSRVMLMSVK